MVYGRVQTVACGNQHTVGEFEGALSNVERAGVRSYFLPPFPSMANTNNHIVQCCCHGDSLLCDLL